MNSLLGKGMMTACKSRERKEIVSPNENVAQWLLNDTSREFLAPRNWAHNKKWIMRHLCPVKRDRARWIVRAFFPLRVV